MDKIGEMGEGIVVQDPPVHKTTTAGATAKGKRSAVAGNTLHIYTNVIVYDAAKT